MADALSVAKKSQLALANLYGTSIFPEMKKMDKQHPLYKSLYYLGHLINNLKRQLDMIKTSEFTSQLVVIADELDKRQHNELADKMDEIIQKSRENVSVIENLVDMANTLDEVNEPMLAEAVDRLVGIKKTAEMGSERVLSTRYCPDHRGVQAVRIAENTYQCPLDSSIYNYETGFENYKGEKNPGGSIAGQTPETSDYGVPMRFYDSRDSILNRIN